jgi:hypothetical protein
MVATSNSSLGQLLELRGDDDHILTLRHPAAVDALIFDTKGHAAVSRVYCMLSYGIVVMVEYV